MERKPPLTFLLLSDPRAGTMMLTDALNHHYSCMEFFNLYASNPDDPTRYHQLWEAFQRQPDATVTHRGTTMHRVGDGWIRQLSPLPADRFWQMIGERHDRHLCLHRDNLLRRFLSRKVGVVVGSYKVNKPRSQDPGPVVLPVQELMEFIGETYLLQENIDSHWPGRLVVTYEQLATDWNVTFSRIQTYLGLPCEDVQPVTCRQETRLLPEAITNYDEVASYLANQGREKWLE